MSGTPEHLDGYPAVGLLSAEAALVKAWAALENFHQDLVVVGGLAIHCHTRNKLHPRYRATSTLDVDFGITLAADAGMAAPAGFALSMAGFVENEEGRIYQETEHGKLFVDFLTEHPPHQSGSRNVSDLKTSVCPGIGRALSNPIVRDITGYDQFGDRRTFPIRFCNYGPLIVLKLNAFANRTSAKKAKDAYDILSLVHSCEDGPEVAVASFGEEKRAGNAGIVSAIRALEEDFTNTESKGPVLAQGFYFGSLASKEEGVRLREDCVTIAKALLDS